MSELQNLVRTPVVYFIDDSATMREVIKIAFRKENIQVVTCPDAASALAQFAAIPPDAVITDVIMPDKDGYEVCQSIKENEALAKTPVILMSGIVNKTVAEKAMSVKADELVRKPFQPADLIARVKSLLNLKVVPEDSQASHALSGLFGPPPSAAMPLAQNAPVRNGAPVPLQPAFARPCGSIRIRPNAHASTCAGSCRSSRKQRRVAEASQRCSASRIAREKIAG